ncbi:MAG: ABC transporter permease [Tannerella sp.]|jgi:hypothetical protein|nr:ABC transporter permease [Tannerella sp.]
MIKLILKQIINRKRSNGWIIVELLLVFCMVWYIADYLFVLNYNRNIPDYRDLDHAWKINIGEYPDNHSRYRADENTGEAREANFGRILRTLRDYSGIEAVTVLNPYCEPASNGSLSTGLYRAKDTTRFITGQQIMIDPREDFFRVFGYTSNKGKQSVSTQDFDVNNPKGIVLSQMYADSLFPESSAVGQEVSFGNGEYYTVTGVIDDVKRFDYLRPQRMFYLFTYRWRANNLNEAIIAVRSRASWGKSFAESFKKEMRNRLRTGNFYLKSVVPYTRIDTDTKDNAGISNDIRIHISLMIFFLLNILLCVMGTFWHRVNTRWEEIGIRKAVGSSARSIRSILFAEGLLLLTFAMLPAMLIEYHFVRAGLIETLGQNSQNTGMYLPDRTHLRFLITNGITWLTMAAVIITAIWIPARRAAALPPAEALHYE